MIDHFQRLGFPRRFSIDPELVEREYLAKSREIHPDFHSLGTPEQQQQSTELTAALNEAYLILRDSFRRAEYLLKLIGGPSAQQEKNLDQHFLMEMMDYRERIEEAKASRDSRVIDSLEHEIAEQQSHRMRHIAKQFDQMDDLPLDNPQRNLLQLDIRHALNAVKTLMSLLRDLHD